MLTAKPVRDLIAAFGSPDPTPGGGSASALAGAVGVALLHMVAALPKTRTGSDEEQRALASARPRLLALREELTELVDRDSDAYGLVVAAYKLPKASEEEKAARRAAVQEALMTAIASPLAMMRACAAAIDEAVTVAKHGSRSASSDVGVALALLRAAGRGAALNVEINVASLADAAAAAAVRTAAGELSAAVETLASRCEALLPV